MSSVKRVNKLLTINHSSKKFGIFWPFLIGRAYRVKKLYLENTGLVRKFKTDYETQESRMEKRGSVDIAQQQPHWQICLQWLQASFIYLTLSHQVICALRETCWRHFQIILNKDVAKTHQHQQNSFLLKTWETEVAKLGTKTSWEVVKQIWRSWYAFWFKNYWPKHFSSVIVKLQTKKRLNLL